MWEVGCNGREEGEVIRHDMTQLELTKDMKAW